LIKTILLFRLLLGTGVELLMPLSMSLINDYYTSKERTQMMGITTVFSNFERIITLLVAGWLASFGWRIPCTVYFLGIGIFMLIFFFLPKGEVQ